MSLESKRNIWENVWHAVTKKGVSSKANLFYRYFEGPLEFGPDEGAVFKDYFTGYYAQGGEDRIHPLLYTILNSFTITSSMIKMTNRVNQNVAAESFQSAQKRAQSIGLTDTRTETIKNSAAVLAQTYQSALHLSRPERIAAVNQTIITLRLPQ